MNNNNFIHISNFIPEIIVNLKYMYADNFIGKVLYDKPYDKLRYGTAKKLQIASDILIKQNYKLVLWDAYRPLHVQAKFWEALPDERFVAPPTRGSKHNRGCAVDVTLADKNGILLEMPSEFDEFSDLAAADRTDLKSNVSSNLKILQDAMTNAGFLILKDEWWHFDDPEWEKYPVE